VTFDRSAGDPGSDASIEGALRRLAGGEVEAGGAGGAGGTASRLDPRTTTLVQIAALVAVGASPASYRAVVAAAPDRGVSDDEIIDAMLAVASTVGLPRLVLASVNVAAALGYDIDAALESPDPRGER
jgi:alkylhydroperoxidase/carboxymuconolactone decarboxylase family protein YurZ